jgi:hypothetical protein
VEGAVGAGRNQLPLAESTLFSYLCVISLNAG